MGRVAIKSDGYFKITTRSGVVEGIHARYCRVLQQGDGYGGRTWKCGRTPSPGLCLSRPPCYFLVKWEALDQIRIIPRGSCYVIEVVYQKVEKPAAVDPTLVAAIDLGVDELAASTQPSAWQCAQADQWSPLERPQSRSQPATCPPAKSTRQAQPHHLSQTREDHDEPHRRVNAYLHTASRCIITMLVEEGVI